MPKKKEKPAIPTTPEIREIVAILRSAIKRYVALSAPIATN